MWGLNVKGQRTSHGWPDLLLADSNKSKKTLLGNYLEPVLAQYLIQLKSLELPIL